jgi:hypothetical protein
MPENALYPGNPSEEADMRMPAIELLDLNAAPEDEDDNMSQPLAAGGYDADGLPTLWFGDEDAVTSGGHGPSVTASAGSAVLRLIEQAVEVKYPCSDQPILPLLSRQRRGHYVLAA